MKKIVIWGVLSILLAGQVLAEELKIVIGLPAGSGPDVITRSVAAELSVNLGKSVVIENRAGAGGALAAPDHIGAEDEMPGRIERLARTDQARPHRRSSRNAQGDGTSAWSSAR